MIYCPVCGGHSDYIGSKEDKPNNTQERLRECDICGAILKTVEKVTEVRHGAKGNAKNH